jgi:two-component system sensor histidine kinase DesK
VTPPGDAPAADDRVVTMTRIGRWWRDRSATERFDLTTRWSMYLFFGLPLLLGLSLLSSDDGEPAPRTWAAAALLLLALAHVVVCVLLMRAALARFLGGTARLGRLLAAGAVVTVAAVAAGALLYPAPDPDGVPAGVLAGVAFGGMVAAAVAPLVPTRWLVAVVAGSVALAAGAGAAVGDAATAGRSAFVALYWVGFMTATYKFSAWMVGVVWELDRGRAAAARLAVAEERLRFSRDLHDVLGRNLSVIAVKSELAGKLAERGEPGAAAEMLEVRKVAHDSLREVRDVVRGYRTADLEAELAGARSVLRSGLAPAGRGADRARLGGARGDDERHPPLRRDHLHDRARPARRRRHRRAAHGERPGARRGRRGGGARRRAVRPRRAARRAGRPADRRAAAR